MCFGGEFFFFFLGVFGYWCLTFPFHFHFHFLAISFYFIDLVVLVLLVLPDEWLCNHSPPLTTHHSHST